MTEDELLAEILEAMQAVDQGENEADTVTTIEVANRIGISRDRAMKQLSILANQGRLQRDMVRRINAWGKPSTVMGWRLVQHD